MVNKLIICVGLPRAGKSTWAREQGLPIVNLDSICLALHGQAYYGPAEPLVSAHAHIMISTLFLAGCSEVILDATNVTKHRRTAWFARKENPAQWAVIAKVFHTDKLICRRRAEDGDRQDLLPVIDRMDDAWDWDEVLMDEPTLIHSNWKVDDNTLQAAYEKQIAYFER